jgi:predicted dehydrogenase
MAEHRCAIIGMGARGVHQAEMIKRIPEMDLVALCEVNQERLHEAGERFGVAGLYASVDAMLADQVPDIVHIMTLPDVRVEPVVKCARAGVKAITMEKPLALRPSEADSIEAVAAETGCKIAVNHQRRYMPHYAELRRLLGEGIIGQIKFVRATTWSNSLLEMGGHMADHLLMFLQDVDPVQVWATSAGAEGFQNPIRHFAPKRTLARVLFPGPVEALWIHSQDTVNTRGEASCYMHLEFDFWGAEGWAWHCQNEGWGYQRRDMAEPVGGPTSWSADNEDAQVAFTRAVGDWLDGAIQTHECNLERSLRGFRMMMGMCKSSLTGQPWEWGQPVTDQDIDDLRALLERREG